MAADNAIPCPSSSSENPMTLTLLVDLDDTLISNSMDTFLPPYIRGFSEYLAGMTDSTQVAEILFKATAIMRDNQRPDRTLKETFDPAFYPALNLDQENAREVLELFYSEYFPSLEAVTEPRPEAVALVKEAFARGYRVVIATNPLFPLDAIVQRLGWANLSPEEYDFALISNYETFHFAKPNPTYFAEVLAQLGWPADPVVMVGDDINNDIEAARCVGLPTYWVTDNSSGRSSAESLPPAGVGRLSNFLPWLDDLSLEDLKPDLSTPQAISAILRANPAALSTLTAQLPEEKWASRISEQEWNLTEIACHLRDVEAEVYLPRVQNILKEENPFIAGIDTDSWAEERNYACQSGPAALEEFTQIRMQTLETLDSLGPEGWQRPARHTIFGPTHLLELVGILASHDRLHLQQIYQILNK